jgi:hypothetical protein
MSHDDFILQRRAAQAKQQRHGLVFYIIRVDAMNGEPIFENLYVDDGGTLALWEPSRWYRSSAGGSYRTATLAETQMWDAMS